MLNLILSLVLSLLAVTACSSTSGPGLQSSGRLSLSVVASGLSSPLYLTSPPSDPRLFVVEQPGRIRVIENGRLLDAPFLDISDRVSSGGERGLFSVAFHPQYASNGLFYVDYTDGNGDIRIERYTVTADPNIADPGSGFLILNVDQPFGNHNGGLVVFGPDGMLYIGLGDGGSGGDPMGHGQNRGTLLGSLLRIDVDGGSPYAVPPDNPFLNDAGARDEIWAYGLRNPWRFSFDRVGGLLYMADVGQDDWEEVSVVRSDAGGLNYGWNVMEGRHCFSPGGCDSSGLVIPALEYAHPDGCSVTGGHVYRGKAIPSVQGHYFYSDFCASWLRSFRFDGSSVTDQTEWPVSILGAVLSFGEDADGELYILSGDGNVYRLAEGV